MNEFFVVYAAEITRKLKSRPFQIGLLIGILGIYGFIELPTWMSNVTASLHTVVLTGDSSLITRAKPLLGRDFRIAATAPGTAIPTAAQLKAHQGATWIMLLRNARGLHVTLYSENTANVDRARIGSDLFPLNLQIATHGSPSQTAKLLSFPLALKGVGSSKFASEHAAAASQTIAFTLLFFLYLLITFNSQLLMSSVAEEKTSRIAELLIASISPTALLYGKIASSATIGLIQMIAWVAEAAILGHAVLVPGAHAAMPSTLVHTGAPSIADIFEGSVSPIEAIAFVLFFGLGFLQLSMLFAAGGSLINRTEDLGSVSFPLLVPVMAGFIMSIVALNTPDAHWVVTASFIPLISPFVMFARIAVTNVPIWHIAISFVINALALWFIAVLAGKLYRVGMLLYGQPPSIRQVWSVIKS